MSTKSRLPAAPAAVSRAITKLAEARERVRALHVASKRYADTVIAYGKSCQNRKYKAYILRVSAGVKESFTKGGTYVKVVKKGEEK